MNKNKKNPVLDFDDFVFTNFTSDTDVDVLYFFYEHENFFFSPVSISKLLKLSHGQTATSVSNLQSRGFLMKEGDTFRYDRNNSLLTPGMVELLRFHYQRQRRLLEQGSNSSTISEEE